MDKIRLMLVDDDRDYLELAQNELMSLSRIRVVGCALTGEEAVRLALELNPDVVLMDIDLPGMNGAQATRAIKLQPDAPKVLTQSYLDASTGGELRALTSADGYICKGDLVPQLTAALDELFGAEAGEAT